MKRRVQSYISFTRTERLGVVALAVILLGLIIVKTTMHLWVKPEDDSAKEKALANAWGVLKNNQSAQPVVGAVDASSMINDTQAVAVKTTANYPIQKSYKNTLNNSREEAPISGHLFAFDPNTLDSAGFIRLGLRAKTTAILLHWRAKGKVFRRKEELKKVYTLTPEDYERLEPYILLP